MVYQQINQPTGKLYDTVHVSSLPIRTCDKAEKCRCSTKPGADVIENKINEQYRKSDDAYDI